MSPLLNVKLGSKNQKKFYFFKNKHYDFIYVVRALAEAVECNGDSLKVTLDNIQGLEKYNPVFQVQLTVDFKFNAKFFADNYYLHFQF